MVLPQITRGGEEVRSLPVTGYTFALAWSPAFCNRHPDSRPDDGQCDPANGRFGFIAHGLWPEGAGRDYPQWCRAAPPVPESIARGQFCIMPSQRLIAHEWAKHGVCATADPAIYFGTMQRLFASLRFPDIAALAGRSVTVGQFKRMFASANPGIPQSALQIQNYSGLMNEVRICLNRALAAEPCPKGRRGAPDRARVVIVGP